MKREGHMNLHNRNGVALLLGALVLSVLAGCGTPVNLPPLTQGELSQFTAAGNLPSTMYRLEPGDALQIKYTYHPEINQQVTVLPDGKINATLVGEITVAALTTGELEKLLLQRTADLLRNPEVMVSVTQLAPRSIYIGGEVGRPGTVPYQKGLTPLQAIIASGGFLTSAQTDSVILIRSGGSDENLLARKLNLAEAITDGVNQPVFLAPQDVVYVPRTAIADANLWVKQHITDMIGFVFRGAGANFGYRLD